MQTNFSIGRQKSYQKPNMRSRGGKKAANERHSKSWTPEIRAMLKREYKQGIDKFEYPTTHYKHLARRILKDENKWRQIKRIIENPDS